MSDFALGILVGGLVAIGVRLAYSLLHRKPKELTFWERMERDHGLVCFIDPPPTRSLYIGQIKKGTKP